MYNLFLFNFQFGLVSQRPHYPPSSASNKKTGRAKLCRKYVICCLVLMCSCIFFYKIFTHGHLLGQRNGTKYLFPAVCQCKASSVFLLEHQPRYQWIWELLIIMHSITSRSWGQLNFFWLSKLRFTAEIWSYLFRFVFIIYKAKQIFIPHFCFTSKGHLNYL